jgi:hypothetical protein
MCSTAVTSWLLLESLSGVVLFHLCVNFIREWDGYHQYRNRGLGVQAWIQGGSGCEPHLPYVTTLRIIDIQHAAVMRAAAFIFLSYLYLTACTLSSQVWPVATVSSDKIASCSLVLVCLAILPSCESHGISHGWVWLGVVVGGFITPNSWIRAWCGGIPLTL